jgi:hypothetical protein
MMKKSENKYMMINGEYGEGKKEKKKKVIE